MNRLFVFPIVEGRGEAAAVPVLLVRLGRELLGIEIRCDHPLPRKRDRLLSDRFDGLADAVEFGRRKTAAARGCSTLILLLLDAEDDCRKGRPLGPKLQARAESAAGTQPVSCVVADAKCEAWFAAGADVDHPIFEFAPGEQPPEEIEAQGIGLGWVRNHVPGRRYGKTVDQKKLTKQLGLARCRSRSRSFDKLCRSLESAARA